MVNPAFAWTDAGWQGLPLERCVFYELHVGTFTREGTFDAVIPHLPRLADLGVTAVELMPVAQFPGTRNWGYDGVGLFAVQNSYGGPEGLKRLVDACHARGLAAVLDVVYNHLGPEGNYLRGVRSLLHGPIPHAVGRRRSTSTGTTATRSGGSSSRTRAAGSTSTTSTPCVSTRCTPSATTPRGPSSPS